MRIAIIPARGGSVRIPRKNVRDFQGKPMLLYPIEAAKEYGFDLIVVSTDDAEIANVAFHAGCVVIPRPTDDGTTGTQEIAARALDTLGIVRGTACVIYPTSPLVRVEDIQAVRDALSVTSPSRFAMSTDSEGNDAGCLYWGWTGAFRKRMPLGKNTRKVAIPDERVCDINVESDWGRAEIMFNTLLGAP